MYFLPPFFIAATPPNMATNSSDAWHIFRAIEKSTLEILISCDSPIDFLKASCKSADLFWREIHNTPISLLPEKVLWWEAVGVPLDRSLKTVLWTMQLMLAACVAYLLCYLFGQFIHQPWPPILLPHQVQWLEKPLPTHRTVSPGL